eukprot:2526018-Amphidinium_carterae.1
MRNGAPLYKGNPYGSEGCRQDKDWSSQFCAFLRECGLCPVEALLYIYCRFFFIKGVRLQVRTAVTKVGPLCIKLRSRLRFFTSRA